MLVHKTHDEDPIGIFLLTSILWIIILNVCKNCHIESWRGAWEKISAHVAWGRGHRERLSHSLQSRCWEVVAFAFSKSNSKAWSQPVQRASDFFLDLGFNFYCNKRKRIHLMSHSIQNIKYKNRPIAQTMGLHNLGTL